MSVPSHSSLFKQGHSKRTCTKHIFTLTSHHLWTRVSGVDRPRLFPGFPSTPRSLIRNVFQARHRSDFGFHPSSLRLGGKRSLQVSDRWQLWNRGVLPRQPSLCCFHILCICEYGNKLQDKMIGIISYGCICSSSPHMFDVCLSVCLSVCPSSQEVQDSMSMLNQFQGGSMPSMEEWVTNLFGGGKKQQPKKPHKPLPASATAGGGRRARK